MVLSFEELIKHCLTQLSLSRVDQKFLSSLDNYVTTQSRITSNQFALFKKIINKYNRQLTNSGLDNYTLSKLTWHKTVVLESIFKYTSATISVVDRKIIVKSPYNERYVKYIRNNLLQHKWDKESKHYVCPFSLHLLKTTVETVGKFYSDINYCPIVQSILDRVNDIPDTLIWAPSLVYINGRYLILCCNEYIHSELNNVDFDKLSLIDIANLVSLGIEISNSAKEQLNKTIDDDILNFASKFIVEIEQNDLDKLSDYLKQLNISNAYSLSFFYSNNIVSLKSKKSLFEILKEGNIKVFSTVDYLNSNFTMDNYVVFRGMRSKLNQMYEPQKPSKIIHIVNSNKVNII